MPTNFNTSFNPGDVVLDTEVKQYAAPINNLETGAAYYGLDTSSSTSNYTVTLVPTPSSYTAGMIINFFPNNDNIGTTTINCNGVGSNIIKNGIIDLIAGDIQAGHGYYLVFDGSNFQLMSSGWSSGGGGGGSSDNWVGWSAI